MRVLSAHDSREFLPQALFYATLVVNTFFSIRFFGRIAPTTRKSSVIDSILLVAYLALAGVIGRPLVFPSVVTLLFSAATLKYVAFLKGSAYRSTLRRKIIIDLLGVALAGSYLAISLLGYSSVSAWGFTAVFLIANMYLLMVRPMYRVEPEPLAVEYDGAVHTTR